MAQNFIACDREQELLLPPSLREWLPEGHLAWFVIDAVGQLDLSAFYVGCRVDGHGRPAHDPAMMMALLLYCYAIGERSSRRIERRCVEDVATRVICANQAPDHTTIARFRQRHEAALGELFGDVLALCAEAGLVNVGVIAIDGTKVHANASQHANRDYERLAREILEEADAVDAEEDERFGDARGDELPPELATSQGRRGWLREAKRRLDEQRAQEARPVPRDRPDRLREARRRLEEEHRVECGANAAYEAYRARGVDKNGKKFGRPPKPFAPPPAPAGKINLSDLDSRNVKTSRGWVQGYNAQAVATEDQIVIAAEVTVDSPDFGHLEPMIRATEHELRRAGIEQQPDVVLADAATGTASYAAAGPPPGRNGASQTPLTTCSSSGTPPSRRRPKRPPPDPNAPNSLDAPATDASAETPAPRLSATASMRRWHELGPPRLGARDSRWWQCPELERGPRWRS